MSFGFGIGDFLAVIELVIKVGDKLRSAAAEYQDIHEEFQVYSTSLRAIARFLAPRRLTKEQKDELAIIQKSSKKITNDLENLLASSQQLASKSKNTKERIQRQQQKLTWNSKEVGDLRARITLNSVACNGYLELIKAQADENAIIVNSISTDSGTKQGDTLNLRQPNTGQWLVESDEFKQWLTEKNRTLFCRGIPGAGKTFLTSFVIDYLEKKFKDELTVEIVYVYCSYGAKQTQVALLESMLKQLVQKFPEVPKTVKDLYGGKSRPVATEVLKELQSVIPEYARVFIVVDALDECQLSERNKFLSKLLQLRGEKLNLFATSRDIPDIVNKFQGLPSLEIRANKIDLERFLEARMSNDESELPSFILENPELQQEIKTTLVTAANGMFLLAQLYLESLVGRSSPKEVTTVLDGLQKDSKNESKDSSKAIDEAYDGIMKQRISDSREANQKGWKDRTLLAKKVLSWVSCAKRYLTTSELQHAMAVEVGTAQLDEKNKPKVEDTVSTCAGLVVVDAESQIVRLVHYTAQDYFMRRRTEWFPKAETDISTILLTYLSFSAFETGICHTEEQFKERLNSNPLYKYAAGNWGHHARSTSMEKDPLTLQFLESGAKLTAATQAMGHGVPNYNFVFAYSRRVPDPMGPVHVASYFGLHDSLAILLERGHNPNRFGGATPLSWAARNGREKVVELLLQHKDVDIKWQNRTCAYERTPLGWAARNGHDGVVRLLLETKMTDVFSDDSEGRTPLWWAMHMGWHKVVDQLLPVQDIERPD